MNSVKALVDLATNEEDTYLSLGNLTITDMNMNYLVAVPSTGAKRVRNFTQDTTEPYLVDFQLDLNVGELTLTFSETVNASSLDVTQITLLSDLQGAAQRFTLTPGSYTLSPDWPVVMVTLSAYDLNRIKELDRLAISLNTTFISITDSTVRDNADNANLPSNVTIASGYTLDSTHPELIGFDLNLSSDTITLSFSETVNVQTFAPQALTLVSGPESTFMTNVTGYTLTGGENLPLQRDWIEFTLYLNADDRNSIKRLTELAVSNETTFISIYTSLINDMNNNPIVAINRSYPLQVNMFTADTVRPTLEGYELSMDGPNPLLTLTFSETVNASSLDVSAITIQSSAIYNSTFTQSVVLTPGEFPDYTLSISEDDPVVMIVIGEVDSNLIKFFTGLAQSPSTTFLSLTDRSVSDMNGNLVMSVGSNNATMVGSYTADTTAPILRRFTLNLTSEQLSLTFDETVDFSSFTATRLFLQSSLDNTSTSYMLRYAFPIGPNSHILTLNLTASQMDLDAIKLRTDLATELNNTFVSLAIGAVLDLALVPNAVEFTALPAADFVPDTIPPIVVAFTVNINDSSVTLVFNEPVDAETVMPDQLQFQNTYNGSGTSYKLTGGSTSSGDGRSIVIDITREDLNEIKRLEDLLVSENTSFISFSSSLAMDLAGNPVVPRDESDSLMTSAFTRDFTRPRLQTFDLDMNSGFLWLYFMETVDILSIDYSCITIQSDFLGTLGYSLTGGSLLMPTTQLADMTEENSTNASSSINGSVIVTVGGSQGGIMTVMEFGNGTASPLNVDDFFVVPNQQAAMDSTVLIVNFTHDDLNRIKALMIAEEPASSWLTLAPCAVIDQSGLQVEPLTSGVNAQNVREYTFDTTFPSLLQFDLDLDTGILHFTFSETVLGTHLDQTQITLQADETSNLTSSRFHTLGLDSYLPPGGLSPIIDVPIKILDLNEIKRLRQLATNNSDTFLSATDSLVMDTKGNPLVPIITSMGQQVYRYTADVTDPRLTFFNLDLNSNILTLTFDETIAGDTFDETTILLYNGTVPLTAGDYYQLVNSSHDVHDSTVISVYLSFVDRNEIRKLRELATSRADTFIAFDSGLVRDTTLNNPVVPLLVDNFTRVEQFVADSTPPVLEEFFLNLTSEVLSLSFTETVDVATLDIRELLLLNESAGLEHRQLRGGVILSDNGPFVDIVLLEEDLNDIKRMLNLATDINDTFISITDGFVQDMNQNRVTAITRTAPLMAGGYFEDLYSPELRNFTLDLTQELLVLSFSETVDPTSVDPTSFTLQSAASQPFQNYTLTGGEVSESYDPLITIRLTTFDLNNIKQLIYLATSVDDTYIAFPSSALTDVNNNSVIEVTEGAAKQAEEYIRDSTPPQLVRWHLDLDADTLILVFDETVSVVSLNVSLLTLQGGPTLSSTYVKLTAAGVSELNDTTITLYLLRPDLNNIKRNTGVATRMANTYLSFPSPTLLDMSGNEVVALLRRAAEQVTNFTQDTTWPVLEHFDFDLNTGTFSLYFNETVQIGSLQLEQITFQAAANVSEVPDVDFYSHTLIGGDPSETSNEPTTNISFVIEDLNEIKRIAVCRDAVDCYISFPNATVLDMNNNPVVGVLEETALRVRNYTSDTTSPRLVVAWQLDLNNGTLLLEFDEVVNVDTFNFSGLTLQSFLRMPQATLTLAGGNSPSENGTLVTVYLLPSDLILLQTEDRLCSNINNCWLSVAGSSVLDMNNNGNVPIPIGQALDVRIFIDDIIPPNLESFSLDMDAGILTLTFDEPVRPVTFNPTRVHIQGGNYSDTFVTLTRDSVTSSQNGVVVVVSLGVSDLNRIKAEEFAFAINDTYLRIDAAAIFDVTVREPNALVGIENGNAIQVSNYTADSTPPELTDFVLDLTTDSLTLFFNEPIRPSRLDATQITILGSQGFTNQTARVQLSGGVTHDADSAHELTVLLTKLDLLMVKLNMSLVTSSADTFVSLSGATLTDMAGNYEKAILPSVARQADADGFIMDTSPAELESFSIDLNEGRLYLTFSDVIRSSSFSPEAITLQDSSTGRSQVSLTANSSTNSPDGFLIAVQLSRQDFNQLQADTQVATSINSTYIILGADVVRDLMGVDIISITDDYAVMASSYVADMTPPQLESFVLDVDLGELRVTFTETVDISSLNVTGFTLVNIPSSSFMSSLTLDYASYSVSPNQEDIVITLSDEDLNELKRLEDLGTSINNTFLTIRNSTVLDMVGLGVTEVSYASAVQVSQVIRDANRPSLLAFTLNMTEGTLLLTFNETVNVSSLNVEGVALQNTPNTYLNRIYLTVASGSQSISNNSIVIEVTIGRDDLNNIKRNRILATSVEDTYLVLEALTIDDMSGNSNVPIYNPFGVMASDHYPDFKSPFLLSFDLDLNVGELILTFDETVETSSLAVQEVTLLSQQNGTDDAVELRQLSPGPLPLYTRTLSSDDPVVVVSLGEHDLNEIKRLTSLATSELNTFLSFSSMTVLDMNNNSVIPVELERAIMVSNLTEDMSPPVIRSFVLDMNEGLLHLSFNETVRASSLQPANITVQNSPTPQVVYKLTGGTVLTNDSTTQTIQLTVEDLNAIKMYPQLATDISDTFLEIDHNGVRDMNSNPILATRTGEAYMAAMFIPDEMSPNVVAFDLDLNSNQLIITFDETVNGTTLRVDGVTLQQFNDTLYPGEYHTLSPPTNTITVYSTVVVIQLAPHDSNEIKRLSQLATSQDDSFLSITNFTIVDMNGNAVNPISHESALPVEVYTVDRTEPDLVAFELNMNTGVLTLTFSETVNVTTFNFPFIRVHSERDNVTAGASITLTGGTPLVDDHHIVPIQLTPFDQNNIKLYTNLATDPSNTFLTISDGAVADTSLLLNPVRRRTVQVSTLTPDTTPPKLTAFAVDLNAGSLRFTFDEVVNALSLDARSVIVQNAQRSRTGVRLSTGSNTFSPNGLEVTLVLSLDDLNEIKRVDDLFVSQETSYVTVEASFIQDMSNNSVVPIYNGAALPASAYMADFNQPSIVEFEFDLDAGTIWLSFSETVNISSFDCGTVTLATSAACDTQYTLTNCTIDTTAAEYDLVDVFPPGFQAGGYGNSSEWMAAFQYATTANITLSLEDLNAIKALEIALSSTTTYLAVTASTVFDQNDRPLLEYNCSSRMAIGANMYTPDSTSPAIERFDLDMNVGLLKLYFSETVRTSTLKVMELSIQSEDYFSPSNTTSFTFRPPSGSQNHSTHIVDVIISISDLNEIKRLTELAISNDTTYLVALATAVRDMVGNTLVPILSHEGLMVTVFIPDTTPPELESYTLDMNRGLLHFTFDETVNASCLDPKQITIQNLPVLEEFTSVNASSAANVSVPYSQSCPEPTVVQNFTLTAGYVDSNDSTVLTVRLILSDLNEVKRLEELADCFAHTLLSLTGTAVCDQNRNYIQEIPPTSGRGLEAVNFIPDATPPELLSFELDLTNEILLLSFSETVNASSLDVTQLTLWSARVSQNTTSPIVSRQLTQGIVLNSSYHTLHIELGPDDLNYIKAFPLFATSISTTYISITNYTVQDMNGNFIEEIPPEQATQALVFMEDLVRPTLTSFVLDLEANELSLTFDETVNVSSLQVRGISLLSSPLAGEERYTLSAGIPTARYSASNSSDAPAIVISVGYFDINAITKLTQLAISTNTTFLAVEEFTIADMNGNLVVPVPSLDPLPALALIPDETSPTLIAFDLDLDRGILYLEFDETVNASSLVIEELLLQNETVAIEDTESYLFLFNSEQELENSVLITVNFSREFLNELKRLSALAYNANSTFLSFSFTTIEDMSGNPVMPVYNDSAEPVRVFTADQTKPVLQSFDVDMNSGTLTLHFDETVRVSTLRPQEITLLAGSSAAGVQSYQLTGGVVQTGDHHDVYINITLFDLNEIKKLCNLATNFNNTYLVFTNSTVLDMSGNYVVPIEDGSAQQVMAFTADTTPPDVTSILLDMNRGYLRVSFTETVDATTFDIGEGHITFYNSSSFDGSSYSLIDSTTNATDSPSILVRFSEGDLNRLKFVQRLASDRNTSFLYLNMTVLDMVGNVITPLYRGVEQPRPVTIFKRDDTMPMLLEYSLDMDAGLLRMTFSELVDDFDVTNFGLQSDAMLDNETMMYYFSGGSFVSGPTLQPDGPGHPPIVTLHISTTDLNAIKYRYRLATAPNTTFLSVSMLGAFDAFSNPIEPIEEEEALQATSFTPDMTQPRLVNFTFSADSGLLELVFDETMRVDSFNVTTVTFVNTVTTTSYTLRHQPPSGGAILINDNSTVISLFLANDDLNELKKLVDLATSFSSTQLSLEPSTIEDMNFNLLNVSNLPEQVDMFSNDTTQPEFVSFNLDMDSMILTLSFSETVNVSTFNFSAVTLLSFPGAEGSESSYTLRYFNEPYPLGTFTNSSNGPEVVVFLGTLDSNEIKRQPDLATLANNTYISLMPTAVMDMVALRLVEVDVDNATAVSLYVEDTTRPSLISFDFDLDQGRLTFTFDETVNSTSIDPSRITIQNLVAGEMYTLTGGDLLTTDDPVVVLDLTYPNLNQVKLLQFLAVSNATTFLRLESGAVLDMAYAPNPSQPQSDLSVSTFVDDTTSPQLLRFMVNMNTSELFLHFDEPVNVATLMTQQITFQSSMNDSCRDNSTFYRLTGGTTRSDNGLQVIVDMTVEDINEIKRREGLLVSQSTTYLSITEKLIRDMRSNEVVPIVKTAAKEADAFISDGTHPQIIQYHLDMDEGKIHLTFMETVNASSINFTAFVLQTESFVNDSLSYYRLTGGSLENYNDSTVVTIIMTPTDLNEIKARDIARSTATSYLVADASGIEDQNRLQLVPLVNGLNAQRAAQYTIDTTRPQLISFDLDMNARLLQLNFSETVRAQSLNVTTITLQGLQSGSGDEETYTLSEESLVVIPTLDGHEVLVTLSVYDSNELKKRTQIATSIETTFISLRASTVYDTQRNYLVPVPSTMAQPVNEYTPDTSPPVLLDFLLDLDSGNLTLTFDETVNATSLLTSTLKFYGLNSKNYTLTGGLVVDCYDVVIVMNLNDLDLNRIKFEGALCDGDGASDCDIFLRAGSLVDMNRVAIEETRKSYTEVIQDCTPPELLWYDLDLTAEELRLMFSEAVRPNSDHLVTIQSIVLQSTLFERDGENLLTGSLVLNRSDPNVYDGSLDAYILSQGTLSGSTLTSGHPPLLVVHMDQTDLDILKSVESVATSPDDTYLLIKDVAITDYSVKQNPVVEINNNAPFAKRVRVYTPDATHPTLRAFDLDMNEGILTMTFSETMNSSSLTPSSITLQGSRLSTPTAVFTLTGGLTQSFDNPVIVMEIVKEDLDAIKRITSIATSSDNTFISLLSTAISDQAGNSVVPVSSLTATRVLAFTEDATSPELIGWRMDMNEGLIHLSFSETVNSSSLDPTLITLQDNSTIQFAEHTIVNGELLSMDGTELTYRLSVDDLNRVKLIDLCTAMLSGDDCYISFPNNTLFDMNGNPVVARPTDNASRTDEYIVDMTPPMIVSFNVNMTYGNVSLFFDETVNVSTFMAASLTVHQSNIPGAALYALTGGTQVTMENGLQVDFYFNKQDLEAIRERDNFFASQFSSYLSAANTTVQDMSGNPLAPLAPTAVADFGADILGPEIVGAVFNLTAGSLLLTFSESVLTSSFRPQELTLQNAYNATSSYTLTGGSVDPTLGRNKDVILLTLTPADVQEIQARELLAVSRNTTWLVHTQSLVEDLVPVTPNPAIARVNAINPLNVDEFYNDFIDPMIFSFIQFSYRDRHLIVQFNEPVDIMSVDPTLFVLQQYADNSFTQGSVYSLTGGSVSYVDAELNRKTIIELSLNKEDFMNVLLDDFLATERLSTHLSLPLGAVRDFAGNPLVDIPMTAAQGVMNFIGNDVRPALTVWDLDINTGMLSLEFDNVVDTSTLDPTALTIQDASNRSFFYTLTGGDTVSMDGCVVVVNVTVDDLNEIKRITQIATTRQNTYLTLAAELIDSYVGPLTRGLDVIAITDDTADVRQVRNLTSDTTDPFLLRFTLDLNADQLILTFDETVNASSFDFTELQLQSSRVLTENTTTILQLSSRENPLGPSTTWSMMDSTEITVFIGFDDVNDLKRLTELGTSYNDSFLTLSNLTVSDMSGNPVVPIFESLAEPVALFVNDSVDPVLTHFSFDVDAGLLYLTFSETVDVDVLQVASIQLIQSPNSGEFVSLTTSYADTMDDYLMTIVLTPEDLNEVKRHYGLAQSRNSTFLVVDSTAVRDMNGNPVVPLPPSNPQQVMNFTPDTTPPELVSFDLDMNRGVIQMTFNETIDVNTFVFTRFSFHSHDNLSIAVGYNLTDGSSITGDSDIVDIQLTISDQCALKLATGLATEVNNTFLQLQLEAVRDMALDANPLAYAFEQVSNFTEDSTPPRVVGFEANLNLSQIKITFNEPVNASSVVYNRIILQSRVAFGTTYTLTGGDTQSMNGKVIVIQMTDRDVNEIKKLEMLLISRATSNLRVDEGAILDMNRNPIQAISSDNAFPAQDFTNDTIQPVLLSFDLDMDAPELLTLHFTETVDYTTLNATQITLLMDFTAVGSNETYRLTGGEVSMADNTSIVISLTTEDVNQLKTLRIGVSNFSTYIAVTSMLVRDQFDIPNRPKVLPVSQYTRDDTNPSLENFVLDVNSGELLLTFTETIDSATFNATLLTLQNAPVRNSDPFTFHTLSFDSCNWDQDEPVQLVYLSEDDQNEIKRLYLLGTSMNDTYLTLQSGAVLDVFGNAVNEVNATSGVQVSPGHNVDCTAV